MRFPACHLAHVPGPSQRLGVHAAAVWICEYPYRTMRSSGPSSDCADCPVWQELRRKRGLESDDASDDLRILEGMAAS